MSGGAVAGVTISAFVVAGAAAAFVTTRRKQGASQKGNEFVNLTSADYASYQPPTVNIKEQQPVGGNQPQSTPSNQLLHL